MVSKKKNPRSAPRTLEQWKGIIEDWEKSGLSSSAYCKEKKLSFATFSRGRSQVDQAFRKENYLKTSQEWGSIINDWEQSGLEPEAYCKKKMLNYSTFTKWEKQFGKTHQIEQEELSKKWKGILADWQKSGLSIKAYCKDKNIPTTSFYIWKKKVTPNLTNEIVTKTFNKWNTIIADWKNSGIQKTAYCKEKRIDYSVFLRWEKKINLSWKPIWEEALEAKKAIVEDWRQTDLTISDYSKEKGIKRKTFYSWKKTRGVYSKVETPLRTLKKWTKLIEEWRISGLSRNAYCKKKGLLCSSFYKWEKRLNPLRKNYQIELLEKQTAIIEDWKKSGLSRYAYCLKNGLTTSSFYQWEKKYNISASKKNNS